jgi:hypothetical protein
MITEFPALHKKKQSIRSPRSTSNFRVRNPTITVYLGRLAGHDTWVSSPPSLAHRLNPMMSSVPNQPAATNSHPARQQDPSTADVTRLRLFDWLLRLSFASRRVKAPVFYPRFLRNSAHPGVFDSGTNGGNANDAYCLCMLSKYTLQSTPIIH